MSDPVGASEARALLETFNKWQELDEGPRPKFFLARIFVNISNFFKGKVYQAQAKQQLKAFEAVEIRLPELPTTFEEAEVYGGFLREYPSLADLNEPDKPWNAAWRDFASKLAPITQRREQAQKAVTGAATSREALHAAAILNSKGAWKAAIGRMGALVMEGHRKTWHELGELSRELGGFVPGEAAKTRIDRLLGLRKRKLDLVKQRDRHHGEYMTQFHRVESGRDSFRAQHRNAVRNVEKAEQELRTLVEPQLAKLEALPESLKRFFKAELGVMDNPHAAVDRMFERNKEVLFTRAGPADIACKTVPDPLKEYAQPYFDDLSKDPKKLATDVVQQSGWTWERAEMFSEAVVDYQESWVTYRGPKPAGVSVDDVRKGNQVLGEVKVGLERYPELAEKRDKAVARRESTKAELEKQKAKLAKRKAAVDADNETLRMLGSEMNSVAKS